MRWRLGLGADGTERGVSERANVVSGDGRTSSSTSGSFSTTGASNSGACRALICASGVRVGSSGEMARMALDGLREVVATNVTSLRLGSGAGGGDEVKYFDDEADWLASSRATGRRRRQPTVRRELYGPHTERL